MKTSITLILLFCTLFGKIPDATGNHGAVVSSNAYASQVGIDILKKGGNAIDAAIATGFALAVVHPGAGNIGGGGFMVIRLSDGTVTTIDFRETAPAKAHRDMFLDENGDVIPGKSWKTSWAAGVPGSVAGFGLAHEQYGTMAWKKLVKPSAKLASKGYKLDYMSTLYLNSPYYSEYLGKDAVTKTIFTKDGLYEVGELFKQKNLAKTLKRIAGKGASEFYTGQTADMIVECMNRTDGLITKEDLKHYQAVERTPITFEYRGHTIHAMPPASSGGVALAGILNQLENIELDTMSYHSADHLHLVAEAERRVYADRAHYMGDMDFVDIPFSELISQSYSDGRWASIDPVSASTSEEISHGDFQDLYMESEETTHYSVVDKWGNAVSVTTTVNGWFGNGITVDGAGFLLNNEMDDFSAKPGVPNAYGLIGAEANAIEPGKRMLSSMTPAIVENEDGELFMVVGSPGGSTIITTVAQIIMNVIDFDMNIEDAVESPRFHHQWLPDAIQYEDEKFSSETLFALKQRNHQLKPRSEIGEANCIMRMRDGMIHASSDSRRGASAIAY